MANMQTGDDLRRALFDKIYDKSLPAYQQQLAAGNPIQAGFAALGAGLGSGLAAAVGGKDLKGPGDIDLQGLDLQTANGNFEAAKRMRESGYEDEALAMEKMGMKWLSVEKASAAGDTASDLDKYRDVTDQQLEGIQFRMLSEPEHGPTVQAILEDAKDKPAAYGGLKTVMRDIGRATNQIHDDLRNEGIQTSKSEIERVLVDGVFKSEAVRDDGWLWFNSPVVDLKKSTKLVRGITDGVMDQFRQSAKMGEPVVPAPHQQSTEMAEPEAPVPPSPEGPAREVYDVQGKLAPEAATPKGETLPPPAKLSKNDRQTLDAVNRNIDKLREQGQSDGGAAIQALIRVRDKLLNKYY